MLNTIQAVHLLNEAGAVICPAKTSKYKATREAWDKLDEGQCGNCRGIIARKEGKRSKSFSEISFRRSRDGNGQKLVAGDGKSSYTPKHGQVRS